VQRVLAKASPGSIVLMHNGGDATLAALPQIVAALRERGYGFVTLSELHENSQNSKNSRHPGPL
jgi:peptidoglycan-N-acetylglucosamine deacetylase